MNFTILEKPDTEKLFDALYGNHNLYLDLSDIRGQPRQFFKKTNFTPNLSVTKNTANDNVKYLLFLQTEYEKTSNAARKIQKYWRRYTFRKIYFRLKELVKRCAEIEPSLALRTVNPREASLLDVPSGAVVRFKLAGTDFPPKIVYKIFSYRPVARVDTLISNNTKHISNIALDKIIYNEYKKNKYNDWRTYEEKKDVYSILKKDQWKKHIGKHRPKSAKPIRNTCAMSWIKNQYGV